MTVETETSQSFDGDQRRETVNTRQRFDHYRDTKARADAYRGSMVFAGLHDRERQRRPPAELPRPEERAAPADVAQAAQARAVASLVARHLPHLPFRAEDLRSFAREVVAAAAPLFAAERAPEARFDG